MFDLIANTATYKPYGLTMSAGWSNETFIVYINWAGSLSSTFANSYNVYYKEGKIEEPSATSVDINNWYTSYGFTKIKTLSNASSTSVLKSVAGNFINNEYKLLTGVYSWAVTAVVDGVESKPIGGTYDIPNLDPALTTLTPLHFANKIAADSEGYLYINNGYTFFLTEDTSPTSSQENVIARVNINDSYAFDTINGTSNFEVTEPSGNFYKLNSNNNLVYKSSSDKLLTYTDWNKFVEYDLSNNTVSYSNIVGVRELDDSKCELIVKGDNVYFNRVNKWYSQYYSYGKSTVTGITQYVDFGANNMWEDVSSSATLVSSIDYSDTNTESHPNWVQSTLTKVSVSNTGITGLYVDQIIQIYNASKLEEAVITSVSGDSFTFVVRGGFNTIYDLPQIKRFNEKLIFGSFGFAAVNGLTGRYNNNIINISSGFFIDDEYYCSITNFKGIKKADSDLFFDGRFSKINIVTGVEIKISNTFGSYASLILGPTESDSIQYVYSFISDNTIYKFDLLNYNSETALEEINYIYSNNNSIYNINPITGYWDGSYRIPDLNLVSYGEGQYSQTSFVLGSDNNIYSLLTINGKKSIEQTSNEYYSWLLKTTIPDMQTTLVGVIGNPPVESGTEEIDGEWGIVLPPDWTDYTTPPQIQPAPQPSEGSGEPPVVPVVPPLPAGLPPGAELIYRKVGDRFYIIYKGRIISTYLLQPSESAKFTSGYWKGFYDETGAAIDWKDKGYPYFSGNPPLGGYQYSFSGSFMRKESGSHRLFDNIPIYRGVSVVFDEFDNITIGELLSNDVYLNASKILYGGRSQSKVTLNTVEAQKVFDSGYGDQLEVLN